MKTIRIISDTHSVYEVINADELLTIFLDVDDEEEVVSLECKFKGSAEDESYVIGYFFYTEEQTKDHILFNLKEALYKIQEFLSTEDKTCIVVID